MTSVLEAFAEITLSPSDQLIHIHLDRTAPPKLFYGFMGLYGIRRTSNSQFSIPLSPVSASVLNMILKINNVQFRRNHEFEDLVRLSQWILFPEYAKETFYSESEEYRHNPYYLQAALQMRFHSKPWRHQLHAAFTASSFLEYGGGFGLWLDMGTGKSKIAIDIFSNIPLARLVLIVCPKTVRETWLEQLEEHYVHGLENVTLLDSGGNGNAALLERNIRQASPGKPAVFIINYDSVWREPLGRAIRKEHWDIVIADEIHRIKTPGSAVSRFFMALRASAKRRLGLSGTPLTQTPLDAYAIYRFLDPQVFNCNFNEFKDKYAIQANMGTFKKVVGFKNLDEMAAKIASISIRYESDEVLDLPETIDEIRWIDMGLMRQYKEMETQFYTKIQNQEITAINGAAKLLKLMQLASGFAYDSIRQVMRLDSQQKLSALIEMLEELPESEPAVVFCVFTAEVENIAAAMEDKLKITPYLLYGQKNDLSAFRAGKPSVHMDKVPAKRILVAQIESGKEGIDLTAARYCIYYSHPLKLSSYLQSRKRIHRPGQTRTCFYYHLIAKHTVEVKVWNALAKKQEVIESVLASAGKENHHD